MLIMMLNMFVRMSVFRSWHMQYFTLKVRIVLSHQALVYLFKFMIEYELNHLFQWWASFILSDPDFSCSHHSILLYGNCCRKF